jgi:hypothetical protein
VQPGSEGGSALEAPQLGIRLQKRLLHHVLCVVLAPSQPVATRNTPAPYRSTMVRKASRFPDFARVRMAASASFTISRLDARAAAAVRAGKEIRSG